VSINLRKKPKRSAEKVVRPEFLEDIPVPKAEPVETLASDLEGEVATQL